MATVFTTVSHLIEQLATRDGLHLFEIDAWLALTMGVAEAGIIIAGIAVVLWEFLES